MRRCSSDAKLQFISSVPPLPLRYSGILPGTFPLLSFLSTADFIFYGYGSQNIFPVHSLLRNSSSWPSTRQKYFFCKCFFTHSEGLCIRFVIVIQYEKSILYTYDTFTEFSLFSEVLFARFHLQVLCFRKIYLSVLPSVILFRLTSDKYFSSGFPFQIIYGSAALWFSSFLSDCSVFLYSYPCIRSFLQEIRFLSLPHIDGCDSTFPMDSPSPFSFFHPFHVTFIYAMNWMIFFCAFLVFFWWVYNSTAFFICQHFFVFFSLFFIVFACKYDLICYLFLISYYFRTFLLIQKIPVYLFQEIPFW